MSNVIVNGLRYTPKLRHNEISEEDIKKCVSELLAIQYFNIKHKNRSVAWDALKYLSPCLAELCSKDSSAAYGFIHQYNDFNDDHHLELNSKIDSNFVPINIVVDGIEYEPILLSKKIESEDIQEALKTLVSIQYFNEEHRIKRQAFNALLNLNPSIAEICKRDAYEAYKIFHLEDN